MFNPAFCELPFFGLIRFSGDDARVFLHNQLSCDVTALATARSTYGSYCTPKGRMLASFLLWRSEEGLFMQLPSSLREAIQKQLARYVFRSKVKAADASGDWTLIGVAGTDAAALVQRAVGAVPQGVHEVAHARNSMVIRLPGDRCEIVAARQVSADILDSLSDGARKADPEYWEWLDIRAGVPVILPGTQEEFVPQMVNLDLIGGVSFEKGCYPGQEIVARMHYRGTLKQRMYLASIAANGPPRPGDKLYSPDFGNQACGTIVNAARSPDGGHDVLASIQIASAAKDDVRWQSLDGPPLRFLPLPYAVSSDP
ncbi:MAG: folate-binding protein YgfZ [Betaproteobacteria bacterium]|nr:folate-binding protein YgfZ [Betaproteobacteria bacterium]